MDSPGLAASTRRTRIALKAGKRGPPPRAGRASAPGRRRQVARVGVAALVRLPAHERVAELDHRDERVPVEPGRGLRARRRDQPDLIAAPARGPASRAPRPGSSGPSPGWRHGARWRPRARRAPPPAAASAHGRGEVVERRRLALAEAELADERQREIEPGARALVVAPFERSQAVLHGGRGARAAPRPSPIQYAME